MASGLRSSLIFAWVLVLAGSAVSLEKAFENRQENVTSIHNIYARSKTAEGGNFLASAVSGENLPAKAEYPDLLCTLSTCGGNPCPKKQERSLDNSTLNLLRRGDPEEGQWRDPSDYGSRAAFITGEIRDATDPLRANGRIVRLPTDVETTTSNYVVFGDMVTSLSVKGLFGCTSIIVISRRGAWASHIWESAFNSDHAFQEMGIRKVHKGDGVNNVLHPFGIDDLRNQKNVGDRGLIFGDKTDPKDNPDLHVFIVTPRQRVKDMTETDGKFYWTKDRIRENPNANADKPPLYPQRLNQIRTSFKNTFGSDVPIQIIDYSPRIGSAADSKALATAEKNGDTKLKDELKANAVSKLADEDCKSPRGKVLVQYRPANDCHEKAKWRIWVEDRDVQGQAEWDPSPSQFFEDDDESDSDDYYDDDEDMDEDMEMEKRQAAYHPRPSGGDGEFTFETVLKPGVTGNGETALPTAVSEPEPEPSRMPLKLSSQHCNDEDDFPHHEDVLGDDVFSAARRICLGDGLMMGPNNTPWEKNQKGSKGQSDIHFRVNWIEDCETEVDMQNMLDPLGNHKILSFGDWCVTLFTDNWKKCKYSPPLHTQASIYFAKSALLSLFIGFNGGVGGWRDAGCLRYYMGVDQA